MQRLSRRGMLLYGSAILGTWALQNGFEAVALDFDGERLQSSMQSRYGAAGVHRLGQWLTMLQAQKDRSLQQQLPAVNTFWNRAVLQSEDSVLWSQSDYWATPLETLGRGAGDCEDYVIGKYFSLLRLGVAVEKLRLIYVRARLGAWVVRRALRIWCWAITRPLQPSRWCSTACWTTSCRPASART